MVALRIFLCTLILYMGSNSVGGFKLPAGALSSKTLKSGTATEGSDEDYTDAGAGNGGKETSVVSPPSPSGGNQVTSPVVDPPKIVKPPPEFIPTSVITDPFVPVVQTTGDGDIRKVPFPTLTTHHVVLGQPQLTSRYMSGNPRQVSSLPYQTWTPYDPSTSSFYAPQVLFVNQ